MTERAQRAREPVTTYTMVDGDHVAYQVAGSGPDLLFLPPMSGSHVDLRSGYEWNTVWYRDLTATHRVISLDRRGLGASDQPSRPITWEDWLDDVVAVLDAVRSDQVSVFAGAESTPLALLLAATYPRRVHSLVLFNADVCLGDDARGRRRDAWVESWGRDDAPLPGADGDPELARLSRRMQRMVASPATIKRLWYEIIRRTDATHILPMVRVPVTVIVRPERGDDSVGEAAEVVDALPDARLVEVPGRTWAFHEENAALLQVIRASVGGDGGAQDPDRVLGTVLFADVVGSTERARGLGDRSWRATLDVHDGVVRGVLEAHSGRLVNTAGDGALALFDGPARAIRAGTGIMTAPGALPVRVGVHTGEIERRGDDVAGIAVHVGARVGALAAQGEVLVSRTVRDLVAGSGIRFEERGRHVLKGLDEEWELYAVVSAASTAAMSR